jgi:hypothetical protein
VCALIRRKKKKKKRKRKKEGKLLFTCEREKNGKGNKKS